MSLTRKIAFFERIMNKKFFRLIRSSHILTFTLRKYNLALDSSVEQKRGIRVNNSGHHLYIVIYYGW